MHQRIQVKRSVQRIGKAEEKVELQGFDANLRIRRMLVEQRATEDLGRRACRAVITFERGFRAGGSRLVPGGHEER